MSATPEPPRDEPARERNDRDLRAVVQVSSALSLGVMAAFLHALKSVSPTLRFAPGWGSLAWGAAAALFSWLFWNLMFQVSGARQHRARKHLRIATLATALAVATGCGFGFALRGIGNRKLLEVAEGTALALLFLGVLGTALWRVGRYFETESRRAEEEENRLADTDRPDHPA